jgi:hypothetical protein
MSNKTFPCRVVVYDGDYPGDDVFKDTLIKIMGVLGSKIRVLSSKQSVNGVWLFVSSDEVYVPEHDFTKVMEVAMTLNDVGEEDWN